MKNEKRVAVPFPRITEVQIHEALFTAVTSEKIQGNATKEAICNSAAAMLLILRLLRGKFGELDEQTNERIMALPLSKLLLLGGCQFDFQSLDDLKKWFRRYSPNCTRPIKAAKAQRRKKPETR